jgi:hypothetical protein
MNQLTSCEQCGGFAPENAARCPNCEHPLKPAQSRWKGGVMAAVGGGIAAIALGACYGPPPLCNLPDGGTTDQCGCVLADGGTNPLCLTPPVDGGTDAGNPDAGDGGH